MDVCVITKGARLRLKEWTECYVEVVDIGDQYFFGIIRDPKTDRVIPDRTVFGIDEGWENYITLDDIVNSVGIQEEK